MNNLGRALLQTMQIATLEEVRAFLRWLGGSYQSYDALHCLCRRYMSKLETNQFIWDLEARFGKPRGERP